MEHREEDIAACMKVITRTVVVIVVVIVDRRCLQNAALSAKTPGFCAAGR